MDKRRSWRHVKIMQSHLNAVARFVSMLCYCDFAIICQVYIVPLTSKHAIYIVTLIINNTIGNDKSI